MKTYREKIDKKFKQNIAVAHVKLEGDQCCRYQECNLGSLVADSLVHHMVLKRVQMNRLEEWTDYPIALVNGGGVRQSIFPGSVSLKSPYEVLPFKNDIYGVKMNGRVLLKALEHSVKDFNYTKLNGRFLQFSGLRLVYDLRKENNNRVVLAEVRCGNCSVPTFEPLSPNKKYSVIINSYMAGGGDGFKMFKDEELVKENFGDLILDCFIKYIKDRNIVIGNEERLRVLGLRSDWPKPTC